MQQEAPEKDSSRRRAGPVWEAVTAERGKVSWGPAELFLGWGLGSWVPACLEDPSLAQLRMEVSGRPEVTLGPLGYVMNDY